MESNITITNKNIERYIQFKLNKEETTFTREELTLIKEIVINFAEQEDSTFVLLNELLKLQNLTTITLRNGFISNIDCYTLLELDNLKSICFENCEFENTDFLSSMNIESLSLINCKINNYLFIKLLNNLTELTIINGEFNANLINDFNNLKYLQLSYSKLNNFSNLNIKSIEELYIDNTNISDLSFTKNLPNLKRISIDEKQYENNKLIINELINNGIEIFQENMVQIGGISNEE